MPRFGELRLVRDDVGAAQRLAYRVMGVADPGHFLHHRYLRNLIDRFATGPRRSILDAGCGSGDHTVWLARRFPEADVLGIDVDADRIASNREAVRRLGLGNVQFEVGDLTELDRRETFDLVVSIDVLEHIPDQGAAIRSLACSLTEDGAAIIHVPTARPRPVPFARWLGDFLAWAREEHLAEDATPEQFLERLREAGFRVLHWQRTFGYYSGELATSLFALPFRNTPLNRVFQVALAPACRILTLADSLELERTRYALAAVATPASRTS